MTVGITENTFTSFFLNFLPFLFPAHFVSKFSGSPFSFFSIGGAGFGS